MKRFLLTAAALVAATPAFAASDADNVVLGLVIVGVTIGGYFLPAIISGVRGHQHAGPIFLLNLFLGWTLIGWVAALVWSAMPVTNRPPPLSY